MTWTISVELMCLWSRCFWIMIYLPFSSESMKAYTQLNDRKFIFEIFKYGSEQMEGDGWSSARQFGTCLCADGQTEQWNKEDQKVKSRDLRSVAALQDTSVGWLGHGLLYNSSTCMGDYQEYQPVRKHHMLHTSVQCVHTWHSLIIELDVGETRHWRTDSTPRGLQVLGIKAPTRATIKSRSADRNEGRKFTHMRSLHTKL